jgi:hypothetical protein
MNVLRLRDYGRSLKLRYGDKVESIREVCGARTTYYIGSVACKDTVGRLGGKPAAIYRRADGVKLLWELNGMPYRENDLPTCVILSKKGNTQGWQISIGGVFKYHRINEPALIWQRDKQKVYQWYDMGDVHREGAPAYLRFIDGRLDCAKWYYRGKLHNIGAPAVIAYGDSIYEEWWENGVKLKCGYVDKCNEQK